MDQAFIRRRRLLLAAAAAWAGGHVGWAGATGQHASALLAEFLEGQTATEQGIELELPEVVDNATSVPVKIKVDWSADGTVFCEEVLVVAEANPYPTVCRFRFTPLMGRTEVETRIRLSESQQVLVLARMSDGSMRQAQQDIMVVLGGCS